MIQSVGALVALAYATRNAATPRNAKVQDFMLSLFFSIKNCAVHKKCILNAFWEIVPYTIPSALVMIKMLFHFSPIFCHKVHIYISMSNTISNP